jgi:anhydro-N-acetylmuramic acid kinase
MQKRLVAGCMTGTSMDGLDVALVSIAGQGLGISAAMVSMRHFPLGELVGPLRALAAQEPLAARRIAETSTALARLHADAVRELAGEQPLDLVAVHGQTVYHAPPVSWQLCRPATIAQLLGVPVVADLRGADLAAGGQGAPITPLADLILFRHPREARVVVNLGGFANYTALPACGDPLTPEVLAQVRGGDLCACNQLLDGAARRLLERPYDEDGRAATAGTARPELRDALAERLTAQARAGRSLGTGDELLDWLVAQGSDVPAADVLRSLADAIGLVIARHLPAADRVLVAGGGARHRVLYEALGQHTGRPTTLTDGCGVLHHVREAAAMAVLGALCQDRVPITLPQVTGCAAPAPVAGVWAYP